MTLDKLYSILEVIILLNKLEYGLFDSLCWYQRLHVYRKIMLTLFNKKTHIIITAVYEREKCH